MTGYTRLMARAARAGGRCRSRRRHGGRAWSASGSCSGPAPAWVSVAFYVWGALLGILLISQFWTLANDIYDPRQAKRLFGFIGGGATLGGIDRLGADRADRRNAGRHQRRCCCSAATLICSACVVATILGREQAAAGAGAPTARRSAASRMAEAFDAAARSRHMQIIALVISFGAVGAAILEQQVNMAAEASRARRRPIRSALPGQIRF